MPPGRLRLSAALLAAATALTALVTGCSTTPGAQAGDRDAVAVAAAFYPLAFAVEQVGGPHVQVTNLTKPGAEPHDLELTPAELSLLTRAPLVVYARGLQPAVDEAVRARPADAVLDVTPAARLQVLPGAPAGQGPDPHFWLDPVRYADVGRAVADRLAEVDGDHAAAYRAAARDFAARLDALDREFRSGLGTCRSRDLVTSHAAFGYLARAYGLSQVGISGVSPDAEPDPAQLAAVAALTRDRGVRTIYAETLVSPALAETLARETGAKVAVLDPVEGVAAGSGADYFTVMRANLAALRTGLGCT